MKVFTEICHVKNQKKIKEKEKDETKASTQGWTSMHTTLALPQNMDQFNDWCTINENINYLIKLQTLSL